MNGITMLACQLIGEGQKLALRTWATLSAIPELPSSQEALPAIEDEEDEEDEVPLVQKRWDLEAFQEPELEWVASGAAAGPSGQGNPYPYRELDRAVADFRLVRFNPNQLVTLIIQTVMSPCSSVWIN